MTHYYLSPIFTFLFICCDTSIETENFNTEIHKQETPSRLIINEIQSLIDSTNSKGSVLIYKPSNNTYYSNKELLLNNCGSNSLNMSAKN